MLIQLAQTPVELTSCFTVIQQLRPHLTLENFLDQVGRQQEQGYQIAYLHTDHQVRSVAGFRILEVLWQGRYLYVDDLVTEAASRSRGFGDALFDWLVEYGKAQGCAHLDLDSGVQRTEAHRFYFRKRMQISSYHFSLTL